MRVIDPDIAAAADICASKFGTERAERWAWAQQQARNTRSEDEARRDLAELQRAQARAERELLHAEHQRTLFRRRLARAGLPENTSCETLDAHEVTEEHDQAMLLALEPFLKWWRDNRPEDKTRDGSRLWHLITRDKRRAELVMRRGVCAHCKQLLPAPKKPKRKR